MKPGTILLTIILLSGCASMEGIVVPPAPRQGPPAHAPAHGHRAKHQADMVFDSGLGVYIVLDLRDTYFHEGVYYRYRDGRWQMSIDLTRGWADARRHQLPPGLRSDKKQKTKGPKKKW